MSKFIIEVRTKGFGSAKRQMSDVKKETRKFSDETQRLRGRTTGLIASLGSLRNKLLVYGFAITAVTKLTRAFVGTASGFEDVKARLVGLMGGVLDAERAFEKFNSVAAKTPFSLDDVVNAGAQLKAFGADAEALLTPITDLAAFMGTTATEAANAFGRAYAGGAGEADIFRTKGVLNIIRDFKGIEHITDMTLPQFRAAMIETFTDPSTGIAGSTERLADTFTGAMSNMGDSLTRLAAEIGSMMLPSLTSLSKMITRNADGTREFIENLRRGRVTLDMFGDSIDVFQSKLRGMNEIADVKKLIADLEKQIQVNKKSMQEMPGDIVSMTVIPPNPEEVQRGFKILKDSPDLMANMKDGVIVILKPWQDFTQAVQENSVTIDNINVGTAGYAKKLAEAKIRLEELTAAEIKRNDILSEENLDEKIRKDKIDVLATIAKIEKEAAERDEQVLDDQIARMEEGAKKTADMRVEADKTAFSMNMMASSIIGVAGALKTMTEEGATAEQRFSTLLSTIGSILMMIPGQQVPGALLQAGSMFVGHTGGYIKDNGIQRFAQGGMVQGRDNVPILAQSGEFIMQRSAVQNIGVDQLTQMNSTGQSNGVTINIQGNMIGNESFVRDTLLPEISKAQGLA
tara:strand:- start:1445 stop:3334 length:1890 start_codon:yes stop_codon:yes gene_type:complete